MCRPRKRTLACFPAARLCISTLTPTPLSVSTVSPTCPHSKTRHRVHFLTWLRCVKKWRPDPVERQRLSFLHVLRDTLLEKLRRSRSFGDLALLRPRPKASLEVYVSVLCPPNPPPSLTPVCSPRFWSRVSRRTLIGAPRAAERHACLHAASALPCTNCCVSLAGLKWLLGELNICFYLLTSCLTCAAFPAIANPSLSVLSFSPLYQTMSLRTVAVAWLSASACLSPSRTPLVPRPVPAPP